MPSPNFGGDLRDKNRGRIEHPDLPETLKVATADLSVALWVTAQAQAQNSLIGIGVVFLPNISQGSVVA
jgi:hypothetical protein